MRDVATDPTTFALALLGMNGVGRVTARRLLDHFAHYEDLCRYPREQILTRLKGAPHAETLVARLLDTDQMEPALAEAATALQELHRKRLTVLAPRSNEWPQAVDDLTGSDRPVLLYGYGAAGLLARPLVALFARPPISEDAFERAQALVRHLLAADLVPVTGTRTGFDVVVHKLSSLSTPPRPSMLVAPCGLARVAPSKRPVVSAAVRAGGLCLSPFPMQHGPFDHDDRERALLQAALARACIFIEPAPGTPESAALAWAHEHGRSSFGITEETEPLDKRLHPLREAIDFDWVVTAVHQGS